jgi:hypothetical protein
VFDDKLLFDDGPVQGNNKKNNNNQGAYSFNSILN